MTARQSAARATQNQDRHLALTTPHHLTPDPGSARDSATVLVSIARPLRSAWTQCAISEVPIWCIGSWIFVAGRGLTATGE